MMTPDSKCPKCRHEMEEGFIADNTYGGVANSTWVAGEPEESFWTGIKTRDKRQVNISTVRCTNCGYLESYAK